MANILGLRNVMQHFRLRYDGAKETTSPYTRILVTTSLCQNRKASITAVYEELYHCSLSSLQVQAKKAEYNQRRYQHVALARRVQDIIMCHSSRHNMDRVFNNLQRNRPVERHHIQAADDTRSSLKGKTTCRGLQSHVSVKGDPVP